MLLNDILSLTLEPYITTRMRNLKDEININYNSTVNCNRDSYCSALDIHSKYVLAGLIVFLKSYRDNSFCALTDFHRKLCIVVEEGKFGMY